MKYITMESWEKSELLPSFVTNGHFCCFCHQGFSGPQLSNLLNHWHFICRMFSTTVNDKEGVAGMVWYGWPRARTRTCFRNHQTLKPSDSLFHIRGPHQQNNPLLLLKNMMIKMLAWTWNLLIYLICFLSNMTEITQIKNCQFAPACSQYHVKLANIFMDFPYFMKNWLNSMLYN